jgi:hypothetical protein
VRTAIHDHLSVVIGVTIAALLGLTFYVVRRIFDRRKGDVLPIEEGQGASKE